MLTVFGVLFLGAGTIFALGAWATGAHHLTNELNLQGAPRLLRALGLAHWMSAYLTPHGLKMRNRYIRHSLLALLLMGAGAACIVGSGRLRADPSSDEPTRADLTTH